MGEIPAMPGGELQPTPAPQKSPGASRAKVLVGAILAVALAVGLYLVNRYWIAPALKTQVKASASTDHPLAPAFSLPDIAGKKITLNDYKGKVVMLDFWATWCGPCRIEIPGFVELQNRYANQGFSVIGISMDDSAAPVAEFYRQFKMNYPVAMGDDRLGELYGGIYGLPTTFLIGRDGRIYAKHEGALDVSVFEEEVKQLLSMPAGSEAANFHSPGVPGTTNKIELGDPEAIDSEVPGVNLSKLTPPQIESFKKQLAGQQCSCGCNLNLLKCRQVDRKCGVSRKLAQQELDKFLKSHA